MADAKPGQKKVMVRRRQRDSFVSDVLIRLLLLAIYLMTEQLPPFIREIQPEELWLYKFHHVQNDIVPNALMFSIALFTPLIVIMLFAFMDKTQHNDIKESSLAVTLTLVLNGIFTNAVKLSVGRPRPDYFYRCFPDGQLNAELHCSGNPDVVMDGRKSFPSGHSSFAFAGLGFTALYVGGKLHCFSPAGRGNAWRLSAFLTPLVFATLIALSRTCDYKHHWQDVLVGSILGGSISYLCYRQHYPPLNDPNSHRPLQHGQRNPVPIALERKQSDSEQVLPL